MSLLENGIPPPIESPRPNAPSGQAIPPLVDSSARNHFKLPGQPPSKTPLPPKDLSTPEKRVEYAKMLAAYAAVDEFVTADSFVIGVGSGSTVPYMIDRIKSQGDYLNQSRWFLPTSFQSKELIVSAGLKLGDVDQFPTIDVTIDGADEIDEDLNAIKGGGACLLREKVVAEAAKVWVLVADNRKDSKILGTTWKQGIPIEVVPFAWSKVHLGLKNLGSTKPSLRMGKAKAGPVVTDNGNFIIDAPFPQEKMTDPRSLLTAIKMITGVVEVGLFVSMARGAYFGHEDGSVVMRLPDQTEEIITPPTRANSPVQTGDKVRRLSSNAPTPVQPMTDKP